MRKDRSDSCSLHYFKPYKSLAAQQWINAVYEAEWKDGRPPKVTHVNEEGTRVTKRVEIADLDQSKRNTIPKAREPKLIAEELSKYYKMLFENKVTNRTAEHKVLRNRKRKLLRYRFFTIST